MTAEEYIKKFKFTDQSGIEFISVENAKIALDMAREEAVEEIEDEFKEVLYKKQ